jgi:hypothetical protein
LRENELLWPKRAFFLAVVSVLIATVALAFMVFVPEFKWFILGFSLLLFTWNAWRFWQVLPPVAIESARNIVVRIPGLRRFFFLILPQSGLQTKNE